jgi:hypothetical protein
MEAANTHEILLICWLPGDQIKTAGAGREYGERDRKTPQIEREAK